MRNKKIIAVLCILLLNTLSGCQLAKVNVGTSLYEDSMVGIFVTTEYLDLFDMEGYLNDNIKNFKGGNIFVGADAKKNMGRIYATLSERILTNEETGETSTTEEYVFPIEGISYFTATVLPMSGRSSYHTSISDPAISDGHTSFGNDSTALEGTIYTSISEKALTFYFNPVYQSTDGRVYLTAGTGMTAPMDGEGTEMSQSMDATTTVTENGKAVTKSFSVKLSVSSMFAPEKIVILQMDTDNKVASCSEYAPDALPKSITPEQRTAYIIVETHKKNAEGTTIVSRNIYGHDMKSIETFSARSDGICVKQWVQIQWHE